MESAVSVAMIIGMEKNEGELGVVLLVGCGDGGDEPTAEQIEREGEIGGKRGVCGIFELPFPLSGIRFSPSKF